MGQSDRSRRPSREAGRFDRHSWTMGLPSRDHTVIRLRGNFSGDAIDRMQRGLGKGSTDSRRRNVSRRISLHGGTTMECKCAIVPVLDEEEAHDLTRMQREHRLFRPAEEFSSKNVRIGEGFALQAIASPSILKYVIASGNMCASVVRGNQGPGGVILTGSISRPGLKQAEISLKVFSKTLKKPSFILQSNKRRLVVNALAAKSHSLARIQIFFGPKSASERSDCKYFKQDKNAIQFDAVRSELQRRRFLRWVSIAEIPDDELEGGTVAID